MKHPLVVGLMAGTFCLLATTVTAREDWEDGRSAYIGIEGGGWASIAEDDDIEAGSLTLKILGGYDFNRHVGIEAAYARLFEGDITGDDVPFGVDAQLEGDAFSAHLRFGGFVKAVRLYGLAGFTHIDAKATVNDFFGLTIAEDSTDFSWGIGVERARGKIRGRGQIIWTDEGNSALLTGGVAFHF